VATSNVIIAHHGHGPCQSARVFENSINSLFCRVNLTLSFEILHDLNGQAIAKKIEKYGTTVKNKKKRNFSKD
jgi:hypothetical protein